MAHGDSPEAALAEAQEAMTLRLDAAAEFGDPLPSAAESRPLATQVEVTNEELVVDLADGRRLSVPLAWFPVYW